MRVISCAVLFSGAGAMRPDLSSLDPLAHEDDVASDLDPGFDSSLVDSDDMFQQDPEVVVPLTNTDLEELFKNKKWEACFRAGQAGQLCIIGEGSVSLVQEQHVHDDGTSVDFTRRQLFLNAWPTVVNYIAPSLSNDTVTLPQNLTGKELKHSYNINAASRTVGDDSKIELLVEVNADDEHQLSREPTNNEETGEAGEAYLQHYENIIDLVEDSIYRIEIEQSSSSFQSLIIHHEGTKSPSGDLVPNPLNFEQQD